MAAGFRHILPAPSQRETCAAALVNIRRGGTMIKPTFLAMLHFAALALLAAGAAQAQQAERPPFATTKVEGTDNVYIFRNGNHQSMFIVTREG
jgi:hypothetical protein